MSIRLNADQLSRVRDAMARGLVYERTDGLIVGRNKLDIEQAAEDILGILLPREPNVANEPAAS
jgi:hypothetical protein